MSKLLSCCCGVALACAAGVCDAAIDAQDLQVMARALSFLERPPSGELRVGIVRLPGNAESQREAEALRDLMSTGLKVGGMTLRGVLITPAEAARSDVGLFLLTAGLGAEGAALGQVAAARHIPCGTSDLAQVRAGNCMIGVRSKPRIEIHVSRAAAARSGLSFSTVFRMMIIEV